MADDWFRRKTWTVRDRDEFFTRLKRSRGSFHKAQYARIQAYKLITTRKRDAYTAALELLDMILAEWREDAQLASVYDHRAECFLGLGDVARAVEAYRLVFQTQRVCKSELTMAHLDFGWLVVSAPLPELYDEAMAVLGEFHRETISFPVDRYRASAIQALILDARGQPEQARSYARIALQEEAAQHSGFRYHPTIGLVHAPDEKVHDRLQKLAA